MATTGFEQTIQGLQILKDTEAQLSYIFDWTDWLGTDTISTVDYSVTARVNDPDPLVEVSSGITGANKKTFIELNNGQNGKTYTVTCKIITANGLIDRRSFRVKVTDRSA